MSLQVALFVLVALFLLVRFVDLRQAGYTVETKFLNAIDSVTCTPIEAGQFPTDVQIQAQNKQATALSIKDGGGHGLAQASQGNPNMPLKIPKELEAIGYRPPKIYIAEKEAWSVFNQREEACSDGTERESERIMYMLIKSNVTHSVVTDPAQADWIYIPFFSVITCGTSLHAAHPNFNDIFKAVRPLGSRFILFTARPWNLRTLVRRKTHAFLRRYPDVVVWSPEIRTITTRQLLPPLNSVMRHVAVQQPPFLMEIPDEVFAPEWDRRFMFCFQGTQLNAQRTLTAEVLKRRGDSFVFANCRNDRKQNMYTKLSPTTSRNLYATCQYCIMPMGDSLSDQRFFDAMIAGCIPVIYEPLKPLVFAQFLDYTQFTFHVPTPRTEPWLSKQLDAIAQTSVAKQQQMRHHLHHAIRSISFSHEHNNAGLHFALALTMLSAVPDPDPALQDYHHHNRAADLQGWWGITNSLS